MADPSPSPRPGPKAPVLVLDTASPVVSIAVGTGDALRATRRLELRRSSEHLLGAIDEALGESGLTLRALGGIAAVRGPGSFTGLRVGLATALGVHQALGLPATGLDALRLLARAAGGSGARHVVAVVDALRGEWMSRRFRLADDGTPEPLEEATLRTADQLIALETPLIGFGIGEALERSDGSRSDCPTLDPGPLAPHGLDEATADSAPWDPGLLVQPIYFRPPATSRPRSI